MSKLLLKQLGNSVLLTTLKFKELYILDKEARCGETWNNITLIFLKLKCFVSPSINTVCGGTTASAQATNGYEALKVYMFESIKYYS